MQSPVPLDHVLAGACVLVVDDEPANVALLERLIRIAGVEKIHTLTDPRQAARRCLEVGADLLLLDLQMPGMDGYEVMEELAALAPDDVFVPVLILTADATTAARDQALTAGAKDFLTKPFDGTEVVVRVRNLLETRAVYEDLRSHYATLQQDMEQRAEADRRRAVERQVQAARIDSSLSGDALRMVYQPIADLVTGEVVGVEALARFACEPERPPNEWFDEAARIGRGPELELAAVEAALAQLPHLPAAAFISVNVSPATAVLPDLVRLLEPFPGPRVVLELTEHAQVTDYDELLSAMADLRAWGMRIAVDDAGAGYSGLRHILRLRPDIIKLDIDLTRDIDTDPARRALAVALVAFAQDMGSEIVAEGIETRQEMASLRGLGVRWGQGFHLAMPAPPDARERLAALAEPFCDSTV